MVFTNYSALATDTCAAIGDAMEQAHFLSCNLRGWGKKSRAYWAVRPAGRLLLFVHGFNGSSTGTWSEFPGLLPLKMECGGCDLVFYGYDSLHQRSAISGADLLRLLSEVFERPTQLINPTLEKRNARPASFRYREMIVVAHSLGAIVARQALIEAGRTKSWVKKVRLVLFAPAHMGASVLPLALSALSAFQLPIVEPVLRFRFQSLLDLEPNSQTLDLIRQQTEDAIKEGKGSHLIARTVILAHDDRIVSPNRFVDDPTPIVILGKGHINVCKPALDYLDPVTELLKVL